MPFTKLQTTGHCFCLKTLNSELTAYTGIMYDKCTSEDFTALLLLDLRNVEEYDHSTTNLFDNFAIGISDRIPSWAMGLESFFQWQIFICRWTFTLFSWIFAPYPADLEM